jgi:hypothetical protein
MATAITELSIKGMTYRVQHYYGCVAAPKSLFDLEAVIDKSANSEQWTGYVSNAGIRDNLLGWKLNDPSPQFGRRRTKPEGENLFA